MVCLNSSLFGRAMTVWGPLDVAYLRLAPSLHVDLTLKLGLLAPETRFSPAAPLVHATVYQTHTMYCYI